MKLSREARRQTKELFELAMVDGRLDADRIRATGAPPEAGTDFMKYLQGRPTGQAHLLADLRRDGQVLSIMQGTLLPSQGGWNEKRQFRVSAMTIALVGGRALYLSAFSAYDSPADIAWLKTVSERWLEDLQRLNR